MLIERLSRPIVKDGRRWYVIMSLSLLNLTMTFAIFNINGIVDCAAKYYGETVGTVSLLANSSNWVMLLFGMLAIPLLAWRLDYSVIGGSILVTASLWIRYLAGRSFMTAFIGSILNSLAQVVALPACIYLPQIWFPIEQRNLAFGIPFYFNAIGLNLGYICSYVYLTHSNRGCIQSMKDIQLISAMFSIVSLLLVTCTIRNKPKSQQNQKFLKCYTRTIKTSINAVFCREHNLFHLSILSVFLGISWSNFEMLELFLNYETEGAIIKPFTSIQLSLMSLCFTIGGIVFGFICSINVMRSFIERTKPNIDNIIRIALIFGYGGMTTLSILITLKYFNFWLYATLMLLMGIGFLGYIPCACQSIIERLFPNRSIVVATVFFICSCVFAEIFSGLSQMYIGNISGIQMVCGLLFIPLLYMLVAYKTLYIRYIFFRKKRGKMVLEASEVEFGLSRQLSNL